MRDVPELLITGRGARIVYLVRQVTLEQIRTFTNTEARFLKNEAYDPTNIDDDAIDEYVSKFSQPGGLRSMFNICKAPFPSCLCLLPLYVN